MKKNRTGERNSGKRCSRSGTSVVVASRESREKRTNERTNERTNGSALSRLLLPSLRRNIHDKKRARGRSSRIAKSNRGRATLLNMRRTSAAKKRTFFVSQIEHLSLSGVYHSAQRIIVYLFFVGFLIWLAELSSQQVTFL